MKSLKSFSLIAVLANFVLAVLFGIGGSSVMEAAYDLSVNPIVIAAPTFALGFIPGLFPAIGAFMAVQTEVWTRDIEENLYNDAEFISMSVSDDDIANNKTVHIPQAGSEPSIVKDRAVFPASASQRTDTTLDYSLNSFSTDPVHVARIEEVQTSYQKRQNVMGEHVAILSQRIGDETAYNWAPTGSALTVLRTTGSNTGALPHGTATGTRNRITKEDVARAAKKLDKDRVPKQGRFLLMQTDMYYELFEINELVRKDFMDKTALPNGVINILFGFNIMVRDTVVLYDEVAAGNKIAVGAAENATDTLACIGWSQFKVRKALESIQVFEKERDPQFYGDVISAEVIFGSSKSRTDDKGIVAIAQGYNV